MSQFTDFVSIIHQQVPVDQRNKFVDQVLTSIDKQKKDGTSEVHGLQVRINATHAARLTGHYHFYQPAKVKKGLASFLAPFPKPVLVNHDTSGDPLGRATSATYIDTPHPLIPSSILQAANSDSLQDSVKKQLGYVKKINKFLNDRTFEGLGYGTVVVNITDEQAIPKILDGRYHTVSVGYDTDALYCSICLQDWLSEGPCEHQKGHMYDGMRMFLIFGDLIYNEISYVNEPADELAGVSEVKHINIPLRDSLIGHTNKQEISSIVKSSLSDQLIIAPERVMSTKQGLYLYDSLSHDFIPISNLDTEQNSGDNSKMNIKDLTSLGKDFYTKLSFYLPEGKALSVEDLAKQEDFVGPNKTFPAFDKEHIDACRKLLETVEDSEDKKEILAFLDTREIKLNTAQTAITTEVEKPVETPAETTDAVTAYTFEIGKDMKVKLPVELNDDVKKAISNSIKLNDSINYSFSIGVNGWGAPDGDEKDVEKEKQILQTLVGLYSETAKDSLNDSLKDKTDEEKTAFISEFADKLLGKTELFSTEKKELEDTIANQRKEYALVQETVKDLKDSNDSLAAELKEFYVEKILFYKSKDDKEDPSKSAPDTKEVFKDKSLKELKASYDIVKSLFDKKSENAEVTEVKDPTQKIEKTYDKTEIQTMIDFVESKYVDLKSQCGDKIADNYRALQYERINSIKNEKNN